MRLQVSKTFSHMAVSKGEERRFEIFGGLSETLQQGVSSKDMQIDNFDSQKFLRRSRIRYDLSVISPNSNRSQNTKDVYH